MPLFGQKRHSNDRKKQENSTPLPSHPPPPPGPGTQMTPTLPPPPLPPPLSEVNNATATGGQRQTMIPARRELLFHSQLAHGSSTKQIQDFSNVKELYQKIAEAFSLEQDEIIFCTLNTHKIDMTALLGSQIGLEDFIYAHTKGHPKEIIVSKKEVSLGLTITDNGAGFAFVKRIREMSTIALFPEVCLGDLIVSINGRSMIGSRHYEVAKLLKELPRFTEIVLKLVEPKKAFDAIGPRSKGGATMVSVMEGDTRQLEEAVAKGEGRATLKMKKNGQPVVEEVREWEVKAAEKVDDLLESFMGIRDMDLAQTMIDMSREKENSEDYSSAMDQELGEFEFPEDFVSDVWTAIITARGTK